MKSAHVSRTLKEVLADLKNRQLKITKPRLAIIQVLIDNHGPFSVKEIYKLITKRVCDQATVYRSIISLVNAKILRRVEFGDGHARFELSEADGAHHHHLICTECKRIEIVDNHELEEIDRFVKKYGFTNIHHTLEFFGTCPRCK